MDKYTADDTVIASAQNAAASGVSVFTPLLCGAYSTWRQRRLFEAAFLLATLPIDAEEGLRSAAVRNVKRFRFEHYGEA